MYLKQYDREVKSLKLKNRLVPGLCKACAKKALVRERFCAEAQKKLQVCVSCVPVDDVDMPGDELSSAINS